MATSKVRAKAKLKKGISRITKMKLGNTVSCEADDSDLSQLRKPIDINMTSLRQIAQLFEKGSDEVREILTYECDVIYECKICRSLFRSLANLISHKRVYCQQKFTVKPRKSSVDPTESIYSKNYNNEKRTFVDFDYKENCSNARILRSQATRREPKKDLTSVVDMLMKKQNTDEYEINCPVRISNDNEQVLLEMMDSNEAAYQTILPLQISPTKNNDLMKTQTQELKDMSNRTAFLGPDGQCQEICSNISACSFQDENGDCNLKKNVPNASSGEDLTCTMCNTKFATKKTLTFHVKCKHAPNRLGYPCPCCSSTFTNRWSVYRHLFKVHRKTNDQVRSLRLQIQARAFRRNPSRPEKLSKSDEVGEETTTEEKQNVTITQEWMKNLELDTELQRCGACGKRFERKAALVSHSQICKMRDGTRTKFKGRFKRASKNPPQRIVEIPEDDISDESLTTIAPEATSITNDIENLKTSDSEGLQTPSIASELPKESTEIAIRVKDVSSLSKDVWDKISDENKCANNSEPVCSKSLSLSATSVERSDSPDNLSSHESEKIIEDHPTEHKPLAVNDNFDVPEVIYTSIDNSRPVALSVLDKEKKLGIQYRGIRLPTVTLEKIDLPNYRNNGASIATGISTNLSVTGSKPVQDDNTVALHANSRHLQCLPCNRTFATLLNLRRHIAVHKRRSRFCCKICDFKAFLKCDFVAHCNKKHNAKNNRKTLSKMIIEMPINGELIDTDDETAGTWKSEDLEVIDVLNVIPSADNSAKTDEKVEMRDVEIENKELSASKQIPTDLPVGGKPRRGRPRKSKGGRKGKVGKRKYNRKIRRHVSPPNLNDDSLESDEIVNIANSRDSGEELSQKSVELERLRAPSRMDCDPELRKMVMEVIFGPVEQSVDDDEKKNSDRNMEEDITIEKIRTNSLDLQEDISCSQSEGLRNEKKIEEDEEEGIQCNRISFSNNNLQRNSKNVSYGDDITIMQDVVLERISTNGGIIELQSREVSLGQAENISSSPHETVHFILYEHGDDRTTGVRPADILFTAES